MKKTLVLLLSFVLSLSLFSQTKTKKANILWGEEYKIPKKITLSGIIGYDNTGIYALKYSASLFGGVKYYLDFIDNSMIRKNSEEINLEEENGKEKEYEFLINFHNKLMLFSSFNNQKDKTNYLFYQTMDKKALKPNLDIKKIAEISSEKGSRYNAGSFSYEISGDSSKLLIYYELPYQSGEKEKFGFKVYDPSMNELWTKDITLPYEDKLFGIEDYEIDNKGNVYILGILYKDKVKEKRHGQPNYSYLVLAYRNNGNDVTEYPIVIPGKFITDMQLTINETTGDIVCGGFYSDEGTFSIKGSYFLTVDKNSKNIKKESYNEFGIDFITQNMTEHKAKKVKKKADKGKNIEMYQYDLHELVKKDDGGAVLIGEQYYVKVVTTTYTDSQGHMRTTTTYYYFYNDIIVIDISPEGDILWTKKIPKKQITANDGGYFSSYALAVVNDKLYFIFNDNPKNLYETQAGKTSNFNLRKEALTVLVEMNNEGEFTREALFSDKNARVIVRPKVCQQISDNVIILFAERGTKEKYAKVTIKN